MKGLFKISFLFLILTPSLAQAWTLASSGRYSFPNSDIQVEMASSDCGGAGFNTTELRGLVSEANERYWNKVSTSALELSTGELRGVDLLNETDLNTILGAVRPNTILVSCNAGYFAGTAAGIAGVGALVCPQGQGLTCYGFVLLNAHSSSPLPSQSRLQRVSILGHEMGHALGLGHTSVNEALMYYSISGKKQERLHIDDMLGISYLYPQEKKAMGLLGACGTVTDKNDQSGGGGPLLLVFILGLLSTLLIIPIKNFKN